MPACDRQQREESLLLNASVRRATGTQEKHAIDVTRQHSYTRVVVVRRHGGGTRELDVVLRGGGGVYRGAVKQVRCFRVKGGNEDRERPTGTARTCHCALLAFEQLRRRRALPAMATQRSPEPFSQHLLSAPGFFCAPREYMPSIPRIVSLSAQRQGNHSISESVRQYSLVHQLRATVVQGGEPHVLYLACVGGGEVALACGGLPFPVCTEQGDPHSIHRFQRAGEGQASISRGSRCPVGSPRILLHLGSNGSDNEALTIDRRLAASDATRMQGQLVPGPMQRRSLVRSFLAVPTAPPLPPLQ
eukprot:gene7762-biopygen9105